MKKRHQGFTLIELLIVVAIIGILAAIAVPNFLNAQTRASVAQVVSNMKALSTAMMCYQADQGSFPLHPPAHLTNIWGNSLTTPVSYIATEPLDIFQNYQTSATTSMFTPPGQAKGRPALHPEPFYTVSGGAYGHPGIDKNIPAIGSGVDSDLTMRFIDAPDLFAAARANYLTGRYIVSVGPDSVHNYPGTYNATNGTRSSGDIIRLVP